MAITEPLRLAESVSGRDLAEVLREGGVAGAGGAGFPTYAKYLKPQPYHMTNAQESEPGYYIDKWLHRTYPREFAELYRFLLQWGCKKIIVAPKYKDREWFIPLEEATGARVLDCRGKGNHVNPDDYEEDILFTYTDDLYSFGKEQALLLNTCGVKLAARQLPTDHGFIVNNTETLYNMYSLLTEGRPVLTKYVHAFGETPKHIFVEAPIGTPAADLFEAAGMTIDEIEAKGFVVVDGGPGWFTVIDDPRNYSITKRTNSLLVIDPNYADPKRKDVRNVGKWKGYPREDGPEPEKEPSRTLEPSVVRIRLTDNPEFKIITPSRPVVEVGQKVEAGQVIAVPQEEGFSINHHASISGTVRAVTDEYIEIAR